MLGLMQHQSLLVSALLEHACNNHPDQEIVSRQADGKLQRSSYGSVARRARQMANALTALGVQPGQRVATLAFNGYRHMELYFAVSGMGAVLHTINPRLHGEQLAYIANHAEDQYLFFDASFAPLVAGLAPQLPGVKGFIAMCGRDQMPTAAIPNLLCYEELIEGASMDYVWPALDEESAASLCYTSGTTGNPKGVLYSHRSTVLHAMAACSVDGLGLSSADTALVAVPMFHVNAWGMPYAGAMCGARLVLPGAQLDGAHVYELLRDERVTLALGVPTVWLMLFGHVDTERRKPAQELSLEKVIIGGAAAPLSMIERFARDFDAEVIHAWGMTELSPLGTVCRLLPKHGDLLPAERHRLQMKQGRAVFGVALKVVDDEGQRLPQDGETAGHLMVRGPWVAREYFGEPGALKLDAEGYFATGDVATIDRDGYMLITDRAKDVIKSGGEWISSIELENAAMGHPDVAQAAVIGVPHPSWQERPLLIAVRKEGRQVGRDELLAHIAGSVARWWLPDDVVFVEALPHTATGKVQKMRLRDEYRNHRLPTTAGSTGRSNAPARGDAAREQA